LSLNTEHSDVALYLWDDQRHRWVIEHGNRRTRDALIWSTRASFRITPSYESTAALSGWYWSDGWPCGQMWPCSPTARALQPF